MEYIYIYVCVCVCEWVFAKNTFKIEFKNNF